MDILCGPGMKWHMMVVLHRCSHIQLLQKQLLIFLDCTVFQQLNRHAKLLFLKELADQEILVVRDNASGKHFIP